MRVRNRIVGFMLSAALALGCASFAWAQKLRAESAADYAGWKIVRVHVRTQRELEAVERLEARILNCITGVGTLEMAVAPAAHQALSDMGLDPQTLNEDLHAAIKAERQRLIEQPQGGIAGGGQDWFLDYKTYAQVVEQIDALVAQRPDLVTKLKVGMTNEGRTIHGLRISSSKGQDKPAVIFTGCQHAREWIAVMVPMYIATTLVQQYESDPALAALVDQVEFFIVPIMNPDGYEYTYAIDGDRLWRKNRRENLGGSFGVDLNRNWSVAWNGGDSTSTNPNSELYVGTAPFSEPETSTVRDFIIAYPQILMHIDFHSYGQLVLQNWHNTNAEADGYDLMDDLGTQMNQAILAVNSTNYFNGWGGSLLYLADGLFPDWCYGERGIIGYTIELRDRGVFNFLLPPEQIIPTCTEAFPAAMKMAEWALRRGEIYFPSGAPHAAEQGALEQVTVRAHAIGIGRSVLQDSVQLLARIGRQGEFTAFPMAAQADGAFNALLPAGSCGEVVEYYIQALRDDGAAFTSPADAPLGGVHEAVIVSPIVAFDFEASQNWFTQTSATSGQWQRGVPVNELNWPYDPHEDADGSGQCWLTLNTPGVGTDVNNGFVRLYSPMLDLASPVDPIVLDYRYFLHLSTPGGGDPLTVEVSANDLSGPWIKIATHETSGSAHWRQAVIHEQDIQAAGAALTSTMRLRFTAADGTPQSIVEAGIDHVRIATLCPLSCIGDISPLNGDGNINVDDLLLVLNAWGPCAGCAADVSGNGSVDVDDLLAIINDWGPCES